MSSGLQWLRGIPLPLHLFVKHALHFCSIYMRPECRDNGTTRSILHPLCGKWPAMVPKMWSQTATYQVSIGGMWLKKTIHKVEGEQTIDVQALK